MNREVTVLDFVARMDTVVDKAGMIADDLYQRATVIIAAQEFLMHPKS